MHISGHILQVYVSALDELLSTDGAFLKHFFAFGTYVVTPHANKNGRYHVLLASWAFQLSHQVIHD
jgi:hypothetical protein